MLVGFLISYLITISPLKRWGKYIETIYHELGHATVGVLLGKKLHGFKLFADTSGVTVTMSNGYGIRGMLTHLAGYPAPIVFGSIITVLTFIGYSNVTMMIMMGVSIYMFLFARNIFAIVPLAMLFGLSYAALNIPVGQISVTIASMIAGLLLILGYQSFNGVYKVLPQGSDAAMLTEYVGGTERLWIILMMGLAAMNSILLPLGIISIINAF